MAAQNRLWGAERIRGELLKLGVKVNKRTIQRYLPKRRRQSGQSWATFLKNHAGDIIELLPPCLGKVKEGLLKKPGGCSWTSEVEGQ